MSASQFRRRATKTNGCVLLIKQLIKKPSVPLSTVSCCLGSHDSFSYELLGTRIYGFLNRGFEPAPKLVKCRLHLKALCIFFVVYFTDGPSDRFGPGTGTFYRGTPHTYAHTGHGTHVLRACAVARAPPSAFMGTVHASAELYRSQCTRGLRWSGNPAGKSPAGLAPSLRRAWRLSRLSALAPL